MRISATTIQTTITMTTTKATALHYRPYQNDDGVVISNSSSHILNTTAEDADIDPVDSTTIKKKKRSKDSNGSKRPTTYPSKSSSSSSSRGNFGDIMSPTTDPTDTEDDNDDGSLLLLHDEHDDYHVRKGVDGSIDDISTIDGKEKDAKKGLRQTNQDNLFQLF